MSRKMLTEDEIIEIEEDKEEILEAMKHAENMGTDWPVFELKIALIFYSLMKDIAAMKDILNIIEWWIRRGTD